MNKKIWYGLCLLFVLYNLKMLVDDRNQVDYIIVEKTDDLYDLNTNFLICSCFDVIKSNDRLGQSDWPANAKVTVQSFLDRAIRSIETRLNQTGLFKPMHSYVFNRHVCFKVSKTDLESGHFGAYLKAYFVRLLVFSRSKIPFFYENVYQKTNSLRYFLLIVHKQKVYDQRYLSNPNCFNHTDQYGMNRFLCLNDCFNKIENFERGFYAYYDAYYNYDSVRFNLSYITQGMTSEYQHPDGFDEKREKCIRMCPENDCFWVCRTGCSIF